MPMFFPTPADFRRWLENHHTTERELVVGFYRKECGKPSITWPESVDEALCFGWIDGIRRKLDGSSYTIRFTPRKPSSIWSKINLAKIELLLADKRVAPAGLKVYESRNPEKTNLYSFEREAAQFTTAQERAFRKEAKAWKFWNSQPPGYRKIATHWVTSAKQESTREKRLQTLIECSSKSLKIPPLRRPNEK
ncbi:MAG TPA: YdeI/OmpD-associated family protein [Candidatus Koribacter sp.]|jgi:uncharacterized protein YdeI (YjbR/CyaY-like superfamily)